MKEYIGREVSVETVHASYDFSETLFDRDKIFCSGWQICSRAPRCLRKVGNDGIVIDDIGRNGTIIEGEHITLSESRYEGSIFLGGINAETYNLGIITKIEHANEKIFQKSPENYMPDDIKEKCRTYKGVPLPPPVDLDE